MTLRELLTTNQVCFRLEARDHAATIREMVDHLVTEGFLPDAAREPAVCALLAREEKSSTGIGGGIAIPHSFLAGIDQVVACYGQSADGIDFAAMDHSPVHFVVLFLVPEGQNQLHLKTLAAISKTLNRGEIRRRLVEATSGADVIAIFEE